MPCALAIRRSDLLDGNLADGITRFVINKPSSIFYSQVELLDRDTCETDDNYVQLIPYITLYDLSTGELYLYERHPDFVRKGEKHQYSVGIGGHIETVPFGTVDTYASDLIDIIAIESVRRLNEATGMTAGAALSTIIKSKLLEDRWGAIYYNENFHDRHHVALSMFLGVNKTDIIPTDGYEASKGVWLTPESIEEKADNREISLDNWSKIVLGLTSFSSEPIAPMCF